MKYDWVPHEVRREQAEGVIGYVVVGVLTVALPTIALIGFLHSL